MPSKLKPFPNKTHTWDSVDCSERSENSDCSDGGEVDRSSRVFKVVEETCQHYETVQLVPALRQVTSSSKHTQSYHLDDHLSSKVGKDYIINYLEEYEHFVKINPILLNTFKI